MTRPKLMLGDKVERLINAVVPKKVIEAVQSKDGGCGCAKRKELLNRI